MGTRTADLVRQVPGAAALEELDLRYVTRVRRFAARRCVTRWASP